MMNKIKRIFSQPETFIYIYFLAFTVFLAAVIQLGSAPDEIYHYTFIEYYANNSLDPFLDRQNSGFLLGSINTETSYLYHYLMSFVSRLTDALNVDTTFGLRFVNVLLGVGTLIGLNYIAKALSITKKIRLAMLFLIANIPMFMFISASISYDNLVILLTVLGVAITLSLRSYFSLPKLVGLTSIILLGPVIKKAFLPLSIVFGLFLVYCLYKNRQAAKKQILSLYKNNKLRFTLVMLALIIPLSMFSIKYIGNVLNYGSIEPKCNVVLTHEECLNNPIYKRTHDYSIQQVQTKTVPQDIYAVTWIKLMVSRTYGLFGHKKFEESPAIVVLALIVTYVFIVLFFRKISVKSFKRTIIPTLFILYMSVLVYTNYKGYLRRGGDIAVAVQGRYALPVLLPFILFVVSLYNKTLTSKKVIQFGLIAFVVIFSVLTGPLYIIKGIDSSWLI